MQVHTEEDGTRRTRSSRLIPDEIDLKLIDLLHEDSRMKIKEIALALGISTGMVHKRMNELEECGIIKKFSIQIDSEKLGYGLTAIINLEIRVRFLHEVNQDLQKIPEIVSLYNVTGDDDVLAICRIRDREHLNDVIQRILKIDYVLKTKTQIALEILKESSHSPQIGVELIK
jgi:Lrp/AsnC family leucine-responsive transcriptional regulator